MTQSRTEQIEIRVANLDCDNDAAVLGRGLRGVAGVDTVDVYPRSAKVRVKFDSTATSRDALAVQLRSLGFPPTEAGAESLPPVWRDPKVVTSAISGVLLLAGWIISTPMPAAAVGTYVLAMLIGGYFFAREGVQELLFERRIGIELLMAIAAVAAALLGAPGEGAMLVFLYSISEAAEGYTEEKTRSAVRALMDLTPKTARVRRGDDEVEIPVEELVIDDVFLVRPGQSVPTDGEVIEGTSTLNQAPVTGESVPVPKGVRDPVFAGSINEEGALAVRVTRLFADNTISRIIHMVEEAQERKGDTQRFVDRFGDRYSPVVLAAGLVLAVVPPLVTGGPWQPWMERAVVFIVAAAPCALVISIPITMVAALGTGARRGVLVKGGLHMEQLARIRVVALDKTGTITAGEPSVTELDVLRTSDDTSPQTRNDLVALAAGIEGYSQHPLAKAIVRFAEANCIRPAAVSDFQSITGAGASSQWNGRLVYVGSPDFFGRKLQVETHSDVQQQIERLQHAGHTVVLIGSDRAIWGWFAIRDNVRPNARAALSQLHAAGIQKIVMLTGDNERTARAIAAEVGIDEVYADLKPEDKLQKIRELREQWHGVAMVGDGVNDAPALAEATVGIAMGAAGTDVALETADVALMADDLERLAYALSLAKAAQRLVNQNLALSVIVIGVLVIGAVLGRFSLPMAVLAHEISEFIVIGNGLRILRH